VATDRQVLLIDLAVPGNFAAGLGDQPNVVLQNLDSIAAQLERNRESRAAAADGVREIVEQEWAEYMAWHRKKPFRALMADRKDRVLQYLSETPGTPTGAELYALADRIMRKVLKKPDALHDPEKLMEIASRYTPLQAV
jgi:glutamyl-tRNA reductase